MLSNEPQRTFPLSSYPAVWSLCDSWVICSLRHCRLSAWVFPINHSCWVFALPLYYILFSSCRM